MSKSIPLNRQDNPIGTNKRISLGRQGTPSAGHSRITLPNKAGIVLSFSLSAAASTSAGVYAANNKLVRTLWSGVHYEAGTHTAIWDKLDDFGNTAPDGQYSMIVQTNNTTAVWEGVIGNTSLNTTGNTVHLGYDFIASICIGNNRLYYATGYSELSSAQAAFDLNNIQVKIPIGLERQMNQSSYYTATDGTNVYWAGADLFNDTAFIYATKNSDNTNVTFTNGTLYVEAVTNNTVSYSAIGALSYSGYQIKGIAVNSQYIFVSRIDNNVYVYDKTGLFVRTIALTNPAALCIGAADTDLWVVSGAAGANVCTKYTINSDGSLTATGSTIPIANIGAIAANSSTLLLTDISTPTQQVKAFNINTLAPMWTLGQAGGYSSSPTVADDKFFFSYANPLTNTFNSLAHSLSFQSDGSFWVLDYGNSRLLHFSSSRTLIEQVGYLGRFYNSSVNLNNPNHILCDWKEYEIDYPQDPADTKSLQQGWKLLNNYGYNAPLLNDQGRLSYPYRYATLSNGRTIATAIYNDTMQVYELTGTGLQDTGKTWAGKFTVLQKDGSYIYYSRTIANTIVTGVTIYQFSLQDANNLVWATTGTLIGDTGTLTWDDAAPTDFFQRTQGYKTDSGNVILFDTLPISINNVVQQDGPHRGYHLAAVQQGATGYQWQTARSTTTNYTGDMPTDGRFDVGNGVNYNAGSCVLIAGNTIIWGYHGEFWKQCQANSWNMVSDKGLFIGQFGYAQPRSITFNPNNIAPAGMAGNAFAASVAKIGNDLYLYHNDESFHGGLHRWKITGLDTIQEIVINL